MNLKTKLAASAAATALMALSCATPVFAAEQGTTPIKIQAEATTVNITVPSEYNMVFKADGTNTLPENFEIRNGSALGGIHVAKVSVTGQNDWEVVKDDYDLKTMAADTKKIEMKVGSEGSEKILAPAESADSAATGEATFTQGELDIAAGGTLDLSIEVERGTFTAPIASEDAFTMTIDFGYNA